MADKATETTTKPEPAVVKTPLTGHEDAQQLASALPPADLAKLKASLGKAKENATIDGVYLASCPGQAEIHIRADSRDSAVELVCLYLGCEPSEVVVAKSKLKAGPRKGDRVLRWAPVAGDPTAKGFEYGLERPATK